MDEFESLSHTKWDCKYHVIFIPKYRRKALYGQLRQHLGEVFKKLDEQQESRIEEGHLMVDHGHMMIAIPPKYAVSQVVGFIKGKSAIHLARVYGEQRRNFEGAALLGQGLFRLDRRSRRSADPRIHQEPGARGPTAGSVESLALTCHPGWRTKEGPRQRPLKPLRAAHILKAPGFAGGWLH